MKDDQTNTRASQALTELHLVTGPNNVQCLKASQQFRVSRRLEDEETSSGEFVYRESRNSLAEFMLDRLKSTARPFQRRSLDGQSEPFGEAASRAVLKNCECH